MSMRVNPLINLYKINAISFSQTKEKKSTYCNNLVKDTFQKEIPEIDKLNFKTKTQLSGLEFAKPVLIKDALKFLGTTEKTIIKDSLSLLFHPSAEFLELADLVSENQDLQNVKVKSLLGFGAYSLAFETEYGEVLKFSDGNQFRNGRSHEWFDLPIRKQGRLGQDRYYYFEEKVSCDKLSEQEIRNFIKEIRKSDFDIFDYSYKFSIGDNTVRDFKKEQFGLSRDGRIYLVDPGCILGKLNKKPKKHSVFKYIKEFFREFFDILNM